LLSNIFFLSRTGSSLQKRSGFKKGVGSQKEFGSNRQDFILPNFVPKAIPGATAPIGFGVCCFARRASFAAAAISACLDLLAIVEAGERKLELPQVFGGGIAAPGQAVSARLKSGFVSAARRPRRLPHRGPSIDDGGGPRA
jgi:hypothetical protein